MGDLKWLNFVPTTLTFSVAGKQIPADQKPARIAIVVTDPYGAVATFYQTIFIQKQDQIIELKPTTATAAVKNAAQSGNTKSINPYSNDNTDKGHDEGDENKHEGDENKHGGDKNKDEKDSRDTAIDQNRTNLDEVDGIEQETNKIDSEETNSDFGGENDLIYEDNALLPTVNDLLNLADDIEIQIETAFELQSAIVDFPELQGYFTSLLTGKSVTDNYLPASDKSKVADEKNKNKQPNKEIPLQVDITGVTALGKVTITANQPIEVRVTNGKLPSFLFQAFFVSSDGTQQQSMDYVVVGFNETFIEIQLNFEDPKSVGQGIGQDFIDFKLLKDYFVKTPSETAAQRRRLQAGETHKPNLSYLNLSSQVPQQMNATAPETVNIQTSAKEAKKAVSSTFFFTFILQFIARGAMKGIWPLYSSLQIMSVYLLYLVKVPSNVILLSEQYNKIINMEFVPKEKVFEYIFRKNPELLGVLMKKGNSTMSDYATKSLGVGNPNMIVNISLIVATIVVLVLCIVGVILLIRFLAKKYPTIKSLIKEYLLEIQFMLIFNSILRSFFQSYLQLSINTMLALKQGKKDENKGNLLVTVLTLLALITFPIFVFFFLKRMANSRAGQKLGLCNLKDSYVFYCKSRKYRRKYQKEKIEMVQTLNPDEKKKERKFERILIGNKMYEGYDLENSSNKEVRARFALRKRIDEETQNAEQKIMETKKEEKIEEENILQIAKENKFDISINSHEIASAKEKVLDPDPIDLEKNLLGKVDIQKRFNSLFLNVDVYREDALMYTVGLLCRRFLLAFVIVIVTRGFFQVWLTILISLSQLLWLIQVRPMVTFTDNLVIILNEFLIYGCGVNLLLFTEYVAEPGKRWNCGYSFMFFVCSCVVVNILTAIYVEGKNGIADLKTKFAQWKAKKQAEKLAAAKALKGGESVDETPAAQVNGEIGLEKASSQAVDMILAQRINEMQVSDNSIQQKDSSQEDNGEDLEQLPENLREKEYQMNEESQNIFDSKKIRQGEPGFFSDQKLISYAEKTSINSLSLNETSSRKLIISPYEMPAPIEAPEKEKKMIDKVETIPSPKEQSTRKLILSPYEIPVSYQKKVNQSQMKGLENSNLIISEQNDEEE